MSLFNLNNSKVEPIKEFPFVLEREIQNLVEANMNELLNLEFVRSEFSIAGTTRLLRIDSLAFDPSSNAFIIVEYKQDKNSNVVDQGYAYLAAALNHQADLVLEYNVRKKQSREKNAFDWSQLRVIFISQSFTPFQKEAVNFKDIPISLWEIKRYSNNTIKFEEIRKVSATASIAKISPIECLKETTNNRQNEVDRKIVVYTEESHLEKKPSNVVEVYNEFRNQILLLGDVEIKATKIYVAFTVNGANFVEICVLKKSLKIWINLRKGELKDPYSKTRDVSGVGHFGTGDYELPVDNVEDLDYIITLIRQAYERKSQQ